METLHYLKPSLHKRQKRRDKRLDEELIECYRGGRQWANKKGYKKELQKDFENAPNTEGMKERHKGGSTYSTDNLEPLIRFLSAKTGKKWDKVYSQLSKRLKKNTMTGLHVFQHLWDFVKINVWIEEKKVYCLDTRNWQSDIETHLLLSFEKFPKFYVHPETGILMKAPLWIKKR
jgi:hypothetical protein